MIREAHLTLMVLIGLFRLSQSNYTIRLEIRYIYIVYMSQSDYINKKKITLQLQKQTELSPILDSSFYTISKGHSIS
jgi:hypothetical protein